MNIKDETVLKELQQIGLSPNNGGGKTGAPRTPISPFSLEK